MIRENSPDRAKALLDMSRIFAECAEDQNKQRAMVKFYRWNKKYRSEETYHTTKRWFGKIL